MDKWEESVDCYPQAIKPSYINFELIIPKKEKEKRPTKGGSCILQEKKRREKKRKWSWMDTSKGIASKYVLSGDG